VSARSRSIRKGEIVVDAAMLASTSTSSRESVVLCQSPTIGMSSTTRLTPKLEPALRARSVSMDR